MANSLFTRTWLQSRLGEWVIGSIRRERVVNAIFLNEMHLSMSRAFLTNHPRDRGKIKASFRP